MFSFLFYCSILFYIFVVGCSGNHPRRLATKTIPFADINKEHGIHPGRNGSLNSQEKTMARIAWQYFEKNYQAQTGLVNAANDYAAATLWGIGRFIGALVSAYELKVINQKKFDERLNKLLHTLNALDFF